jgi:Protein of unknown function (DUF3093)
MPVYHERLHVPLTWWLLAVPVVAVLGGELYAGFGGLVPLVIYAVFAVAVAGFLLAWGMTTVSVSEGVLVAGGAALPLESAGDVTVLDEQQFALLRGPRGDPAAWMVLRPYFKRGVYVAVTDTSSQHPYWLIGSRHPAELAAAIGRSLPATRAETVR